MAPILHSHIPEALRAQAARRLPGMSPLSWDSWLWVDEAYAAQMALRERLLQERAPEVLLEGDDAAEAARELLALVVDQLVRGSFAGAGAFSRAGERIGCPDGREVLLDATRPLHTLGHLVQHDFCILTGPGAEARLTGAVLCFPAKWRLADKAGHGLGGIHAPVPVYDAELAARVGRLFNGLHPERPLWRANLHRYDCPDLYQPEPDSRMSHSPGGAYERSERQCLIRLPQSRAVVFSIHTLVALHGAAP